MLYAVTLLGADGCPVKEDKAVYTADKDPFEKQSRALLQAAHLYHQRGGRKQRLVTLEASQRLKDENGRPLPHHLPETVKTIVVCTAHGGSGNGYLARYEVRHLEWKPVTLSIPEGGGNAYPEHGDFTEYELQPYEAEFAHSPWEVDRLYLRPTEPLPYPDDSPEACRMVLVMARARWPQDRYWLHGVGRNLRPAKVQVIGSRIRPQEIKAARKGRRQ